MGDPAKPVVEIQIPAQDTENKDENQGGAPQGGALSHDQDSSQEMPTITTLLQRKKLSVSKSTAAENAPQPEAAEPAPDLAISLEVVDASVPGSVAEEVPAITAAAGRRRQVPEDGQTKTSSTRAQIRKRGEPPPFASVLVIEKMDLKAFEKALKKHKKLPDIRKLDFLGYWSGRFTEMAYYEVQQTGVLQGVLGFGNPALVSEVKSTAISPQLLPSVFEILAQGEIFVGAVENLRAEDQAGLSRLGFQTTAMVGAFPVTYKKSVTGLWLTTAAQVAEIPPKELKSLKKLLTDFVF